MFSWNSRTSARSCTGAPPMSRGPVAWRQKRERRPVAPLNRQFLHLTLIDVAADDRAGDVEQRRLSRHRDCFLNGGERHLEGHDSHLADEELQTASLDSSETRQLAGELIGSDADRKTIDAALVGDSDELVSSRLEHRRNRNARKDAARGVSDGSRQDRFLRVPADR